MVGGKDTLWMGSGFYGWVELRLGKITCSRKSVTADRAVSSSGVTDTCLDVCRGVELH